MMTKRNYEAIAKVFRNYRAQANSIPTADGGVSPQASLIAAILCDLADELAADNPRFDRRRFFDAARGVDSSDSAGRTVRYSAK